MAKMIRVKMFNHDMTTKCVWLNTDRIGEIEPKERKNDTDVCEICYDGYDCGLLINETARELANRINYE